MRVLSVEVMHFRNILNSGEVVIEPDVTCLVGKNESGKTAFLKALHRFNPAQPNVRFNSQRDYPAWLEKRHRREGDIEAKTPVTIEFEFEDTEWTALERKFGVAALTKRTLKISRTYKNTYSWRAPEVAEHVVAGQILQGVDIADETSPNDIAELDALIDRLQSVTYPEEDKTRAAHKAAEKLSSARKAIFGEQETLSGALWHTLHPWIPHFFYFDEYSQLPGSVKIRELLAKDKNALTPSESTARSLLELAGADTDYLLNPDYETRKRELENVANSVTEEVLAYWSTNPELRTDIDVTLLTANIPTGQTQVLDELKIRLYDNRHLLSLGFEEHSTGFRWFFSFLAAFSEYEGGKAPLVILLDEPGLGLHARAQRDFLRFIDERLSKKRQVIYSTHSPFMVQPGRLERIRLVQDNGRDVGSKVTADVLSSDRDTIFPLQAALGYDLAQHLFISPHNLVVEGTSDFTYLSLLSKFLLEQKRTGLDEKWSIVPVGGADLIPTFVALLGNHLNVTVLVDSRKEGHQRLDSLKRQGILKDTRLVLIGDIIGSKQGDIEDLFEPQEYLDLFNKAFGKRFKLSELAGSDPIVKRLARLLNVNVFDHGKPADVFLRTHVDFLSKLSNATLERFEKLFERINATLDS